MIASLIPMIVHFVCIVVEIAYVILDYSYTAMQFVQDLQYWCQEPIGLLAVCALERTHLFGVAVQCKQSVVCGLAPYTDLLLSCMVCANTYIYTFCTMLDQYLDKLSDQLIIRSEDGFQSQGSYQ